MEPRRNEIEIGINEAQSLDLESTSDYQFRVWGRGTGKTTSIGIKQYLRSIKLPKAKFFFTAKTYKQILNNCLPPMEDLWRKFGLVEYDWKTKIGHYVIGQKPPAHFEKPYKPPRQFEHVVSFWTGYAFEMFSQDRPSPHRGGNFDGGDGDEIALMEWEDLEQNLLPTIRGNKDIFGYNNPLHGKFSGYTTMPWLSKGLWVLGMQEKALADPKSFSYQEATALCNLHVLGFDWLDKMKKILTPLTYELEIENKRIVSAESSFYHNFSDTKHVYTPMITYRMDPNGRGIMEDRMHDYSSDQLLDIAWDFGGWFNCAAIFQQQHDSKDTLRTIERMINSFSVGKGGSARAVVRMITEYYSSHRMKYARIWGEPRGNDPTGFGTTLYEDVADEFRLAGWQVEMRVFQSQAHSHDIRHTYMNEVLGEKHLRPKLRINEATCKAPIIAFKITERGPDGKKDKSSERDRNFDQKHAPHFTDATDYYFMQKHYTSSLASPGEYWH